jgi:K+/H+ antiporter YhaU regulatory subunit KhtT
MDEKIDLAVLARQQDAVLGELRTVREDMTVMMEIMRRLDHRVSSLETAVQSVGTQLTDMHAYNRRVEQRVHKLEETHR